MSQARGGAVPADLAYPDRAAHVLGEKVRILRERKEWTQHQLARASGVSRTQIQNIEHSRNNGPDSETGQPGRGNPRLETIY